MLVCFVSNRSIDRSTLPHTAEARFHAGMSQHASKQLISAGTAPAGAANGNFSKRKAQAEEIEASTAVGSFELVSENAAPASAAERQTPLSPLAADEWATFLDARGRISDPALLWGRVYRGGVTPGLRKEVWTCHLKVALPGL